MVGLKHTKIYVCVNFLLELGMVGGAATSATNGSTNKLNEINQANLPTELT